MSQTTDASLSQRLDQLATRGRRHLTGVARRDAGRIALDWAAATLLIAGAAALFIRLVLSAGALAVISASLVLVPAAAIVSILVVRRPAASRLDALALFDHRLELKGRIVASDEFQGAQDGFRRAALMEAAPWVDRAIETPLGKVESSPEPRGTIRRRWAMAAAGIALMAIAALVEHPFLGDHRTRNAAEVAYRGGAADAGDAVIDAADSAVKSGGGDARSDMADAGGTDTAAASTDGRQQVTVGAARGTPAATSDVVSGSASTQPSTTQQSQSASSGNARLEGGGASSAAAASASLSIRDQAGAAGSDPSLSPNERGQAATADAAEATARTSSQPGQLPKRRDAAFAPDSLRQDSRPGAGSGQQGGSGNQMGSGAGRGSNRDGLKRSRGVGSLLLAVPMEDRFIGTANAGPVRSMTRPAQRSEASPSTVVQAGNRGARAGDSGRIVHAPTSLHDQRLIRAYFDRR